MQIAQGIYSTHIQEDPSSFGAMHPGGTQIYFVGDPDDHMVLVDSGEPYRSWTRQILDLSRRVGAPPDVGHPDPPTATATISGGWTGFRKPSIARCGATPSWSPG